MKTIPLTASSKNLTARSLVISLTSAAALLGISNDTLAGGRSTSATGPNGHSISHSVTRSNGNVSSSTTAPNGNTATRVVERSADGTTSTMQGLNGNTATRTTTRTDTSSQTTVTHP